MLIHGHMKVSSRRTARLWRRCQFKQCPLRDALLTPSLLLCGRLRRSQLAGARHWVSAHRLTKMLSRRTARRWSRCQLVCLMLMRRALITATSTRTWPHSRKVRHVSSIVKQAVALQGTAFVTTAGLAFDAQSMNPAAMYERSGAAHRLPTASLIGLYEDPYCRERVGHICALQLQYKLPVAGQLSWCFADFCR